MSHGERPPRKPALPTPGLGFLASRAVRKSISVVEATEPMVLCHGGPKKRVDSAFHHPPQEKNPFVHRGEERIPTVSKFSREPARSPGLSTPKGCQLSHLPLVSRGRPREMRPRPAVPTGKCQGPLPTRLSQISFPGTNTGRTARPHWAAWDPALGDRHRGGGQLLAHVSSPRSQGTPTSQRSRHDGFDGPGIPPSTPTPLLTLRSCHSLCKISGAGIFLQAGEGSQGDDNNQSFSIQRGAE